MAASLRVVCLSQCCDLRSWPWPAPAPSRCRPRPAKRLPRTTSSEGPGRSAASAKWTPGSWTLGGTRTHTPRFKKGSRRSPVSANPALAGLRGTQARRGSSVVTCASPTAPTLPRRTWIAITYTRTSESTCALQDCSATTERAKISCSSFRNFVQLRTRKIRAALALEGYLASSDPS